MDGDAGRSGDGGRMKGDGEMRSEPETPGDPASAYPDSRIVRLNVGGRPFDTYLSTLIRVRDSTLAAMFSGRHPLALDEQGRCFIDRDPKQFARVLAFLRTGVVAVPRYEAQRDALAAEAEFFGISEIVAAIAQAREEDRDAQRRTPPTPKNEVIKLWLEKVPMASSDTDTDSWYARYEGKNHRLPFSSGPTGPVRRVLGEWNQRGYRLVNMIGNLSSYSHTGPAILMVLEQK